MSNQIEVTTNYISGLKPLAIPTDKNIGDHVVNKFMAMYQVPRQQALAFYEREKDNFMKRINDSEDLKACTSMSIFISLMQVFGWGLSFEPGEQADVYLIPGNRNIAPKDTPAHWIKDCLAQPSPYGKKKIRIQNGQIKGASKPQIVYKGDKYREFEENGKLVVIWEKGERGENPVIVSSFVKIEKSDGSYEYVTFDLEDVKAWKIASEKKNKGKSNHLYTSNNGQIDKLFFEGKTLTHAFKGYPKVINAPKVPETFVPDEKSVREGLDISEFTEEANYSDVTVSAEADKDEFDQALSENKSAAEPTMVLTTADDNEPEF